MSLKYGLTVKNKAASAPVRRPVLDEEDDDDDDVVETPMPRRPTAGGLPKKLPSLRKEDDDKKQDLSSMASSNARVKAAEEIDSSIFDYDSFHDAKSIVNEAKKAADRHDAVERKPKYINNLLDAAARRKQDQLIAREKLLQKEREAEGDEFAGKDKFVTGAYKQHQEEARRLEEEEKKKSEDDEKRKRAMGGGMQGFYKTMMDQREKQHQEAIDAAAKVEAEGTAQTASADKAKSDADLVAELKAKGVNVNLNEEGQITDKRELLSAGLNVAPSGKGGNTHGADHLRASNRPAQSVFQKNVSNQQAQRERQSRMMEEQLAEKTKRAREEEEEERVRLEKASKSLKTDKDVGDAKARYLARKAAKERGK